MKRLWLIILLLPFLLSAQEYMQNRRKSFTTVTACSTLDTTNLWDNFIEGFQNASGGFDSNQWTLIGTTNNITSGANSSALTSYKPPGCCDKALKIVWPTDGTETYAQMDLGANIDLDAVQTDFYLNLYIETGPDDTEGAAVFGYRNTTTPSSSVCLTITNRSGNIGLYMQGSSSSSIVNVNVGQWYTIRISLDIAQAVNGSSLMIWSGGSLISSQAFKRAAAIDLRYLFVGAPIMLDANDSATLWFDVITIKTP